MTFDSSMILSSMILLGAVALSARLIGRRPGRKPAMTLAAGLLIGLIWARTNTPALPMELAPVFASAGLGLLGFVCAAQLKVSSFAKICPASFRLTTAAAPLFLIICTLTAFIMLPGMTGPSALLIAAALMLNGAAFDRTAVAAAPVPQSVKRAVRFESAAIVALGVPVAAFAAALATTPGANEPALLPLFATSLGVLKGFCLGGVAGLIAGAVSNRLNKSGAIRRAERWAAPASAVAAFGLAPIIGGDAIVAATAAGLLWGEQTKCAASTRGEMRRFAEGLIGPATYFGFGALVLPRLFQADLLSILFAIAAVTALRAGPRLSVLQHTELAKESQGFLAWYGGAPGVGSALFLMTLIGNPAIANIDAILTIGALCVTAGVIVARGSSQLLVNELLRQSARARRRRAVAG